MPPPDLAVTPAEVAAPLGLDIADPKILAIVTAAIVDAQVEVEAYLGRFIIPRLTSEPGRVPTGNTWNLDGEDIGTIVSATAEVGVIDGYPTGYYTVAYYAGLDVRTDARPTFGAVRRYLRLAAQNCAAVVRLWREQDPARSKLVKSVSADGQSISYTLDSPSGGEVGKAGSGTPGAAPDLTSLDSLRLAGRRAFQRPGAYNPYAPANDAGWW